MAKRVKVNRFKAGKLYWIVTATFKRPDNPNVYMETWTTDGRWTVSMMTGYDEPRVYYTMAEAEAAVVVLAARFPDKIGRFEIMPYSKSEEFKQVAP